MESREVTTADGESTSLDDLCPGSDEQLRRCINWIGDVWRMVGYLVDRLANEHAAVSSSDHAYSSAIARSRDQAHFLIQQRQGAEDRLACLALQVSEHLLVPLIEIAVACTLIDSSYQNVREEGMDRFCAAADWWGREAKSAVELMLTTIEDRRRRDGGCPNPLPSAESEAALPASGGDSVNGIFLDIEIDDRARTISRRGFDVPVNLNSRPKLWDLFLTLYRSRGEPMSSKDESSLEGEKSGRRKAASELREFLLAVGLTVSRSPYCLVESVTPK